MSQMKPWKRWFVLLSVLGIGLSVTGNELAAWQLPGVPQAAGSRKAKSPALIVMVNQSQAAAKLDENLEPLVRAAMSDDAQKAEAATRELRRWPARVGVRLVSKRSL